MNQLEIKTNIIDKAIEYFAPVQAGKRYKARAALAISESYTGASRKKRSLSTFNPKKSDANSTLEFELDTLQDRSRDMIRNNSVAGGLIETNVTSVVGSGLSLDSRIDYTFLGMDQEKAAEWERNTEREFSIWAESIESDLERSLNFYEMQELAFRSTLESGDVFVITPRVKRGNNPYTLKLQLIESDRCSNPDGQRNTENLSFGIGRDGNGAPSKYYFSKFHPGSSLIQKREWREVKAFGDKTQLPNVLHLFFKLRPGQSRGIPYLAPVIDPLRQISKYTDTELTAAVVAGAYTVFIKSEADIEDLISKMNPDEAKEYLKNSTNVDYSLGNGAIVGLLPGEDISTANPGRPNSNFDPFVAAILAQVGARLGIPYELVIKRFTASYSAAQAAFLEAWREFRKRRTWLAYKFCQPVYELFLYEAVSLGRISAPGFFKNPSIRKAYSGAQWFGDPMGHIDPLKAANAATARINNLTSTIQRETIEIGGEWDKNQAQIKTEMAFKKEVGISATADITGGTVDEPDKTDESELGN